MDEEKITLPASKMRARNADFQSNGGYPVSNKRAKRSSQEVKEQDWPGEKSYGSTSPSSPKKKPKIASLLDVSKSTGSPSVTKGTMDSDLLLSMRTGAKRSSPTPDDDEVDASASPATPVRAPSSKPDRSVTTPGSMGEEAVKSSSFPERLMELFEGDVAKDAMWWLPGGDAFALSPDLFPDQVLQKYFQGTKFESFTRKLNRWGFKRLAGQRVPTNCVAYYHNLFQKGKSELLKDMRSGKKKDADLQDALLQLQLRRDLEAVGLANAYGSHSSLGNLPPTQSSRSPPQSSRSPPHSQPAPSSAYGGLGGRMSGLSGMDNESLLRSLLQQQQQSSNPLQQQQSNPLAQELQTQSMLGRNYAADYTADLALQRQVQLLASAEQLMRSQRLQQQQDQEHQRQQQASLVSELQQRLLGGSGFGSGMSGGSGGMPAGYSDVTPSMLLAASQQGQSRQGQLPSSYGSSSNSSSQMDSRLIQLLLQQQQQQQRQQEQGRR